jgi:hypothetical protein
MGGASGLPKRSACTSGEEVRSEHAVDSKPVIAETQVQLAELLRVNFDPERRAVGGRQD